MVVIRLSRGGANKKPFYRIVVADSRAPRDGLYLEKLGYFNPAIKDDNKIKWNYDRVSYWLKCGAQPSKRVRNLFTKYNTKK